RMMQQVTFIDGGPTVNSGGHITSMTILPKHIIYCACYSKIFFHINMATDGNAELQQYTRISDIAKEPQEMLMPIRGYEQMPIVTLEETVAPLISILPLVQD
ncbi:unnamed protein product, partial [Adineta steineri]